MPKVKPSTTKYQPSYEFIYPWIARDPKISTNALCIWCKTTINISSMGKSALQSHVKSQKHNSIVANRKKSIPMKMFVQWKESEKNANSSSSLQNQYKDLMVCSINETATVENNAGIIESSVSISSTEKKSLKSFLLSDDVSKAEILWCLRTVMSHLPIRTSAACVESLPVMFSDSQIAKKMQLGRTKISYSIVYGIAPHFHRELINLIQECSNVVLEFDESLNTISQKAQMDIYVRFWHPNDSIVTTRYFNSVFLQRTRAIDLYEALSESFGSQNLCKILQLSMDGPNVNLKVLNDFNKELTESFDGMALLNIGSCGLHVIHGAFKTGMKKSNWEIVSFLRAMYYLFKDSPTRRAQYTEYTKSNIFPKKFCAIRWVENVAVAERAIEIVPHLRTYVIKSKKEKTAPSSQSFKIVSDAINDKLIDPKLTFFSATASLFEPFLREFQADVPMAPFLYNEIHTLIYSLMQRVVKSEVLNSTSYLNKIDLSDKNNLIFAKQFEMDFATKDALKKVKDISELQILQFKDDMRNCIIRIIEKIYERSPLKYKFTEAITCLDPMVALNLKIALKRLTSCLEILVSARKMSGVKADRVKQEYVNLCGELQVQEIFKSFKRTKNRLDKMWVDAVKLSTKPCDNFIDFVKLILILSHGNATVERGFSVNAECLIENQLDKSLIAQRRIYDTVKNVGDIENINIDKKLLHSMRNAHSHYKESLAKQREAEKQSDMDTLRKRKARLEIKELEAKKVKYLAEVSKITAEIDNSIADLKK